jgi:2-aminoethylphosphonate-pyruvate transaminase
VSAVPGTAVILAAGRGARLGPRGLLHPKGFIEMGGETLVERSLRCLRAQGVRRVVIVTGHLQDRYQALARRHAGVVELVHNPRYADSGSMHSLHAARGALQDEDAFWLLESDLVYEQRALDEIARREEGSALLMSGPTGSGDEVYVAVADGRLRDLSKQRERLADAPAGELVGISRIDRACFGHMLAHAERVFCGTLRLEYEQALVAAAARVPVACLLVPDLAWSEIDTEEHWRRVHHHVHPEIVRRDASRPSAGSGA